MITLRDSLDSEKTGDATIDILDQDRSVEAEYSRDEEGNIVIGTYDDVPVGQLVLLVLKTEDGDSEYRGSFNKDGQFA